MTEVMNCRGLKGLQPVLKVAIKAQTLPKGTILEVHADGASFPSDITKWCNDSGKVLVNCVDHGTHRVAMVQL